MTLEWLLIVAAIAGLAAGSVLAVQRIVDDSTDRPPREEVRVIDAEIAAAAVAHEATQIVLRGGSYTPGSSVDREFERRCLDVASRFSDVVQPSSMWKPPAPGSPPDSSTPARCILVRR